MIKNDTMDRYIADRAPQLPVKIVHIHQGGTVHSLCRRLLTTGRAAVSWDLAFESTCPECRAAFYPGA